MRVSFILAALTTLLLVSTTALANSIIFDDYTTGVACVLGENNTNAVSDAQFNTITNLYGLPNPSGRGWGAPVASSHGNVTLGLSWAGDSDDVITFVYIVTGTGKQLPLIFTAFGPHASQCNVNVSGSSVQLTKAVPFCNLTLTWTAPFAGNLVLDYQNQTIGGGQSSDITLFFIDTPPPAVVGDPQFVGLRGQEYQIHGVDGGVYNLITESASQVNSRFVFLTEGECPVLAGKRQSGCWSHPGSYMGDMSFQAVVDGKLHAALVTAGSADTGFAQVQMDGKQLSVGDKVAFGSFSIEYTSSHEVAVTLDNYSVRLANSDMFLNLALTATKPLSQLQSHGLIGQTHSTKTYKSLIKYIEGQVDDYLVAEDDVFGTGFPFNKFQL